ncbi:hypothetical protein [Paenibacillus spongiae]|uniref:Spore coat protein n=1 Tax=Paenibacillus spongiae TaxID=2909671 RepID=A0ABY5S8Q1_9BACL|nr:hypothetical protein [Paenibacillus spongiae]UVI30302.1 hypothetical protein L1F29_33905 [Paenibacillus spongiae]
MWKWTGWFAKTVAAGLIISFLSIWTTGYIVNSYVETLLKQFKLPLDQKPFALDGVWGSLWGADPVLKSDVQGTASTDDAKSKDDNKKEEETDREEAGTQGGEEEKTPAADASGDLPPGSITDIGGGSGTKAGGSASSKEDMGEAEKEGIAMTEDQLSDAKNRMSAADKESLFEVMMTKLPQEAWQQISTWMEDGITASEMTDIQQLVAQHLSREEYDKMMEILKKY